MQCAPTQWFRKIFGCVFRLANRNFLYVRSGQYPLFSLFGPANTHFSVYSVWPMPTFQSVQSVQSVQYPLFSLFGPANTHFSVYSVWPMPTFQSVRSVQSSQYPLFSLFSLFSLFNTHFSVCSVWPILTFQSVRSGHIQSPKVQPKEELVHCALN